MTDTGRRTPSFATNTILFLLAFAVSQGDKQVIGLIAEPIKRAFLLSDTALGVLQGVGFALAFAIGGLPLAQIVDRGHRIRIAAACVAIWSLATILCGAATSFALLFLMRAATAVAEAGLAPAFFSLLSGQGDPRRIARTTSLFMLAPFLGGGLVLILGGALLRWGAALATPLPVWSQPWRLVFLALGLPGLGLAAAMGMFGHEAHRVERARPAAFRAVFRLIFVESASLRAYYLGLMAFTAPLYALISWYPALLIRQYGAAPGAAGAQAGLVYLAMGISGTFAVNIAAGWLARSLGRVMALLCGCAALLALALAAIAIAPTITLSLTGYAIYAFLSAAILALMPVPIQLALPHAMVGRGIAVWSLVTSAISGAVGPMIVGLLSDRAGLSLQVAAGWSCALAMTIAALLFSAAGRSLPAAAGNPDPSF